MDSCAIDFGTVTHIAPLGLDIHGHEEEAPFGPLFGMSRDELVALKNYIEENLSKEFMWASSSPAGDPLLLIKKGDSSLRVYVD